jgi:hypothetical protein
MLQIDVAAASASVADFAFTHTASAIPKLKEWPIVPDEVQIPMGISFALTISVTLSHNGELPA